MTWLNGLTVVVVLIVAWLVWRLVSDPPWKSEPAPPPPPPPYDTPTVYYRDWEAWFVDGRVVRFTAVEWSVVYIPERRDAVRDVKGTVHDLSAAIYVAKGPVRIAREPQTPKEET